MLRFLLAILVWLALVQPGVAAEPPQRAPSKTTEAQFAFYHETLIRAASEGLTNINGAFPQPSAESQEPIAPATDPVVVEQRLRQFAERYWGGRTDDLREAVERLRQFQPVLEPILRAEGVPSELIVVVLIESAAVPTAQSPREARGLWQFIPETARRYGLVVNLARDERLDTLKATRAAARYLRDLYLRFGDWSLALAAYNAGEQAVQRAIDRTGLADFLSLSSRKLLPGETRRYVPAVLAAIELVGDPAVLIRESDGTTTGERAILFARMMADD